MDFGSIKAAVAAKFTTLAKGQLYRSSVSKDDLWTHYLASFPEGSNPLFKERSEHDCNCCKSFIRAVGDVVAIVDGELTSIWDVKLTRDEPEYQAVADAMSALVKAHPIKDQFLHYEATAGQDKSFQQAVDGVKTWRHFFVNIPAKYAPKADTIATTLSQKRSSYDVLVRSLNEISLDAVDTVLELIANGSLYRGEEHKFAVTEFRKLKIKSEASGEAGTHLLAWQNLDKPESVLRIRNSSIGTLLTAVSEGKDLEVAVKSFEAMVAPSNYKRPTALVTKGMIEKAKQTIEEMRLTSALQRRYAVLPDITINNVLFADRSAKAVLTGDVFDELTSSVATIPKSLDKVEEVPISKFVSDILPLATSIEVMVENRHTSNFVSLIAPTDPSANQLFKWGNGFSWSYAGEVADSLREKVRAAGGRVDGVLRFSHSWNHVGRNASLMDLHVFTPTSTGLTHKDGCHDGYPTGSRVGWNSRTNSVYKGVQDVDYTDAAPEGYVPVENITFPDMKFMKEGAYIFKIHNWALRQPTNSGFKAEIEFEGQVFEYDFPRPLKHKEWVTVAVATLKNGKFTIEHKIPVGQTSRQVWGIPTQTFRKVNAVMMSPNFWDDQVGIGNKHFFFMLEGCANESQARGFYNEFLKSELDPHRKVMEMVGSKLKTAPAAEQLSGIGFSSTQPNTLLCRVKGKFTRTIKVVF